jgi:hypothetical protein
MTLARGWFFPLMTVAIALTVLVGFGPTYFFRSLTGAPPLPWLTHVHGLAFSGWVLLLTAQVWLVGAGRRDVHRRLGVAGAGLAVVMVWMGIAVALATARRDIAAGRADDALGFLIIPLGDIVAFAGLVAGALVLRARRETHRRLMLLATLAILVAAIGRIPWLGGTGGIIACFLVLLAAAPVYDWFTRGRPHPVSLWGGAAVFLFALGRFLASESSWWRAIAARLV